MNQAIKKAKKLMHQQVQLNGAPSELLIDLAVRKGIELSRQYKVNQDVVTISLYLAHVVFSPEWGSDIQNDHPKLSAEFVKPYLSDWNVCDDDQVLILNAIRAHHDGEPCDSQEAEVMKNAECFKFVSGEGAMIWLHELGLRGYSYKEAQKLVLKKLEQKLELLTLDKCICQAEKEEVRIKKILVSNNG